MANVSQHEKYCRGLSLSEHQLVTLRDELFNGSWDQFMEDLKNRLKRKPYIFKLVNRLQDDIERIEKLRSYEKKHHVNLADYLHSSRQKEEE